MFKKAITAWVVSGIASILYALLTCRWLFKWVYAIDPSSFYRAGMISGQIGWLLLAGLVLVILAAVAVAGYAVLYNRIPKQGIMKGLAYGFFIWLITFATLIRVYVSINMTTAIVTYWMASSLINTLLIGAIIGAIYKK